MNLLAVALIVLVYIYLWKMLKWIAPNICDMLERGLTRVIIWLDEELPLMKPRWFGNLLDSLFKRVIVWVIVLLPWFAIFFPLWLLQEVCNP